MALALGPDHDGAAGALGGLVGARRLLPLLRGPSHQQVIGQHLDEHFAHPRRHFVGGRVPVVDILTQTINFQQNGWEWKRLTRVMTVTMTDSVTRTMVKSRYFPVIFH